MVSFSWAEIEQIRVLLNKMGEDEELYGTTSSRGPVRLVSLSLSFASQTSFYPPMIHFLRLRLSVLSENTRILSLSRSTKLLQACAAEKKKLKKSFKRKYSSMHRVPFFVKLGCIRSPSQTKWKPLLSHHYPRPCQCING